MLQKTSGIKLHANETNFCFSVTNTAFGGSIDLDVAIRWTFICNFAVANQFRCAQSLEMGPSATKHVLQLTFSIYSKHCVEYVPPDFLRYLTLMLTNAATYIVSSSNKARQVRRLSPCHPKPLFVLVLNFPQIFPDDAPFSTPFQEFSHSSPFNTPQITRGIRISVPWFVT